MFWGKAIVFHFGKPFGDLHSSDVSTQSTVRCFGNSMACAFVFVDVDGCVTRKNEGYICHFASLKSHQSGGQEGRDPVLLAQALNTLWSVSVLMLHRQCSPGTRMTVMCIDRSPKCPNDWRLQCLILICIHANLCIGNQSSLL